jgi:hypothetical protein
VANGQGIVPYDFLATIIRIGPELAQPPIKGIQEDLFLRITISYSVLLSIKVKLAVVLQYTHMMWCLGYRGVS